MTDRTNLIVQWGQKWGDANLPTICLDLRMSCNGAADPWSDDLLAETVWYLKERLRLWEPGQDDPIDQAVKAMCYSAITYGEVELADRVNRGHRYPGLNGEGWVRS